MLKLNELIIGDYDIGDFEIGTIFNRYNTVLVIINIKQNRNRSIYNYCIYNLTTIDELNRNNKGIDLELSTIISEYCIRLLQYKTRIPIQANQVSKLKTLLGCRYMGKIDETIIKKWVTKSMLVDEKLKEKLKI